jgi:hypothetical protein
MNDVSHLPILDRLQFARRTRRIAPRDPAKVIAQEILKGVIEVLEAHPNVARLNTPEPR